MSDSTRDPQDAETAAEDALGRAPEAIDRDSDPAVLLLQQALAATPAKPKSSLPHVQERIRKQTRGRYFKDRWSQLSDPVPLMLVIALFLLVCSAAFFLVLQPLVESPTPVKMQSPPTDPLQVN